MKTTCRRCGEVPHVMFTQAFLAESFEHCVMCKMCETTTPPDMFNIWKTVMDIEEENNNALGIRVPTL